LGYLQRKILNNFYKI